MAQVVFDFPPTFFSALRRSPEEFAAEMRLAAAIHWYSQTMVSQGKAAEIAAEKLLLAGAYLSRDFIEAALREVGE